MKNSMRATMVSEIWNSLSYVQSVMFFTSIVLFVGSFGGWVNMSPFPIWTQKQDEDSQYELDKARASQWTRSKPNGRCDGISIF